MGKPQGGTNRSPCKLLFLGLLIFCLTPGILYYMLMKGNLHRMGPVSYVKTPTYMSRGPVTDITGSRSSPKKSLSEISKNLSKGQSNVTHNHIKNAEKMPNGLCNGCYKWRFELLIVPEYKTCNPAEQLGPDLILLVTSIHKNRLHRSVIRNTWGSYAKTTNSTVRVFFAFGLDPEGNQTEEALLRQEANDFGDIIQVGLNATYRKSPEVVLNSYTWVSSVCTRTRFVGKVTDDVYLNIPELLRLLDLRGKDQLHDVIFGQCTSSGTEPVRRPGHKWHVSLRQYPYRRYPIYCSGAAFFLSRDLLSQVLATAGNITFPTGLDDILIGRIVRVTGHCTCNVPGLSLFSYQTEFAKLSRLGQISCERFRGLREPWGLHLHGIQPKHIALFWKYKSCLQRAQENFATLKCPRKGTCKRGVYHIEK